MKLLSKKSFLSLIILPILFITILVIAGTELVKTTAPSTTMYTLTDIYNLIHNNTTAVEGDHDLSPTSNPTATTSYSVPQLYADLANLIKRENIATGTVYLGVTGAYGTSDPAYATTTVIASSLIPQVALGNAWGYSLDDIYELITNNSTTTAGSHSDTPSIPTASSMHTLTEIYTELTNLIDASKVRPGVTYLGVAGNFGPHAYTWTGAAGTSLNDGSNYSPNGIPDGNIGDTLDIPADLSLHPANGSIEAGVAVTLAGFGSSAAGTIDGGTFNGTVSCAGVINGGTFGGTVELTGSGGITNGTFNNTVNLSSNLSTIAIGSPQFNAEVTNSGHIAAGTFNANVINNMHIEGGTYTTCTNNATGEIFNGATFSGVVTNYGYIGASGGGAVFNGNFFNESGGSITDATFNAIVTNKSGARIDGGTFYHMLTNSGTINNGNFMEFVTNTGTINDGQFCQTQAETGGTINGGTFNINLPDCYNYTP